MKCFIPVISFATREKIDRTYNVITNKKGFSDLMKFFENTDEKSTDYFLKIQMPCSRKTSFWSDIEITQYRGYYKVIPSKCSINAQELHSLTSTSYEICFSKDVYACHEYFDSIKHLLEQDELKLLDNIFITDDILEAKYFAEKLTDCFKQDYFDTLKRGATPCNWPILPEQRCCEYCVKKDCLDRREYCNDISVNSHYELLGNVFVNKL